MKLRAPCNPLSRQSVIQESMSLKYPAFRRAAGGRLRTLLLAALSCPDAAVRHAAYERTLRMLSPPLAVQEGEEAEEGGEGEECTARSVACEFLLCDGELAFLVARQGVSDDATSGLAVQVLWRLLESVPPEDAVLVARLGGASVPSLVAHLDHDVHSESVRGFVSAIQVCSPTN